MAPIGLVSVSSGTPNFSIDREINQTNSDQCTITDVETPSWWEIDLGYDYVISHVVVYNREDCCGTNNFIYFTLFKLKCKRKL